MNQKHDYRAQLLSHHPQKSYGERKESTPHGALLRLHISICETRPRLQLLSKDLVWLPLLLVACITLLRTLRAYNGREFRTFPKPPNQSEPIWNLAASARIGIEQRTKTKGLDEISVLEHFSSAPIIQPNLIFGPEDDFFYVCMPF